MTSFSGRNATSFSDRPTTRTLKPWSDDHIALLKEAYAAGRSVDSIAAELDRSRLAVTSKAFLLRLGSKRPRYTPYEEMLMRRWKGEGRTYAWMARELGRSTNSVGVKLTRMRKNGCP